MSEGKNCANCQHATEKSTFPPCAECFANAKAGNQFPGWIAKEMK